MADFGFIYIFSNDSMPDIYKVGFTMKSPVARANELSNSTSCPAPFDVVCYAEVQNPANVEAALHEQFQGFRVNERREFFRFDITDLITYACYSICEPSESGAIHSVHTEKYQKFLEKFKTLPPLRLVVGGDHA